MGHVTWIIGWNTRWNTYVLMNTCRYFLRHLNPSNGRDGLARSGNRCLLAAGAVLLASFVLPAEAQAATLVVDDSADTTGPIDGACPSPCTLREAIAEANAAGGPNLISFNLGASTSIAIESPLVLTSEMVIDGLSQPGATAALPTVQVVRSATAIGSTVIEMTAAADGSSLIGLILSPESTISANITTILNNADNATVSASWVGFGADGASASEAATQLSSDSTSLQVSDSAFGNAEIGIEIAGSERTGTNAE